jgi:hypothetical protein
MGQHQRNPLYGLLRCGIGFGKKPIDLTIRPLCNYSHTTTMDPKADPEYILSYAAS